MKAIPDFFGKHKNKIYSQILLVSKNQFNLE